MTTKGKILAVDIDSEGRFVFRVAKADAPLFKAAPDMYEALKFVSNQIKAWNEFLQGFTPYSIVASETIKAALAKAEGKENDGN